MTDVAGATGDTQVSQEAPPSFDDTLNAEIDKIFEAADQTEGRPQETGTTAQERGPDGKFVARAAEGQAQQGQPQQQAPLEKVQDQIPEAPASWSAEAKAHWATLSPEVRSHLIDREGEVEKSLAEHGERLKSFESLERIIGPRRAALAQSFGSEAVALEHLFSLSDMAGRDFPGFVRFLAQQRGEDLTGLAQKLVAQASGDPAINTLLRKVETLESKLGERDQAEQQDQERNAQRLIDEFKGKKSDKGELVNPHFEAVKTQIGNILKAGAATTLEQAYKIAVAADDRLQARIKADSATAEKKRQDEEAKEKADKARRLQRSDLSAHSGASSARPRTLDDSINEALDKANVT